MHILTVYPIKYFFTSYDQIFDPLSSRTSSMLLFRYQKYMQFIKSVQQLPLVCNRQTLCKQQGHLLEVASSSSYNEFSAWYSPVNSSSKNSIHYMFCQGKLLDFWNSWEEQNDNLLKSLALNWTNGKVIKDKAKRLKFWTPHILRIACFDMGEVFFRSLIWMSNLHIQLESIGNA